MSADFAHLNGRLLPLADARISPLDRGFLFGDGVYEVIAAHDGEPQALELHLARLQRSLDAIGIRNPHNDAGWRGLIASLIEANGRGNLAIYLQVTRGADETRDHRFPNGVQPTIFGMASPFEQADEREYADGVHAVSQPDSRWARCDIKSVSLLANVLARQHAENQGAVETILLRDGIVTEGSHSTVIVVTAGQLYAPLADERVLPSVTRQRILELAAGNGIHVTVGDISEVQLRAADEVLLLSTITAVAPVTRLDGRAVGRGKPGDMWRTLFRLYRQRAD